MVCSLIQMAKKPHSGELFLRRTVNAKNVFVILRSLVIPHNLGQSFLNYEIRLYTVY